MNIVKKHKAIIKICLIAFTIILAVVGVILAIKNIGRKQEKQSLDNSSLIAVNGEIKETTTNTAISDLNDESNESNVGISDIESSLNGTSDNLSDVTQKADNDISQNSNSSNKIDVLEFRLNITDIKLTVGETFMPIVTVLPSTATDKSEIWSVSDTSIAVVDQYGNITALKAGFCTVNVSSASNPAVNVSAFITVTDKQTDTSENNSNSSSSTPYEDDEVSSTYINGILIVNKSYALPKDYNPGFNNITQAAFEEMQADAVKEELNLYISSGFRSYEYQEGLYQRYVNRDGATLADTYSARPGHSEHQTGLAFDLNTIDNSFANTAEGKWVAKNCYKYGFIIRYPADKVAITGYQYEPWHLRYLGIETATAVYNSGLCLEEYLGIDSAYKK